MANTKVKSKIKARIFFEVLGWPAEALTKHLETVLGKLAKTWKLTNQHIEAPILVDEKHHKMMTAHAEFEAEIPSAWDLFMFALLQGPSVIEIIEPAEIYLKAGELQDILSDVVSKAQTMDKEIKLLAAQNKILQNQIASFLPKKEPDNGEVKI